jgi:hypothetical protein
MAIGTAIALGLQAYGAYQNFSQAAEASRLRKEAEKDAERAMSKAKKFVEKTPLLKVGLAKEAYRRQQEAANVSAAQAIEALRESERGMGRLGGVYSQKQMIDADIASRMAGDIYDLNILQARAQEQDYDALAQIELQEKAGQELYMSDLDQQIKEGQERGFQAAGRLGSALTDLSDSQLSRQIKANIADRRAGREAAQLAAMGVTDVDLPTLNNTGQSSVMQTGATPPSLGEFEGLPIEGQLDPYNPFAPQRSPLFPTPTFPPLQQLPRLENLPAYPGQGGFELTPFSFDQYLRQTR